MLAIQQQDIHCLIRTTDRVSEEKRRYGVILILVVSVSQGKLQRIRLNERQFLSSRSCSMFSVNLFLHWYLSFLFNLILVLIRSINFLVYSMLIQSHIFLNCNKIYEKFNKHNLLLSDLNQNIQHATVAVAAVAMIQNSQSWKASKMRN